MEDSTTAPELPSAFKLSNGAYMPAIGYGTFQLPAGQSGVKECVRKALEAGYRHLDTAAAYANEKDVGEAIKESGIPRSELFVTTKLYQTSHQPEDVEGGLDRSLEALQLSYVDLYLMHFPHAYCHNDDHSAVRDPSNGKPAIDHALSRAYPSTWKAMEALVDKGKARAIGISNFNILKTKRILEVARIRPAVNQVELHPYLSQKPLLEFCKKENIHLTAHSPLGGRPVGVVAPNAHVPGPLQDLNIQRLATTLGCTPARVLLSWAVQRGTSVVPKSATVERIVENLKVFRLSQEDFDLVDGLKTHETQVRYLDPRDYIGFDIFDEEKDQPVE